MCKDIYFVLFSLLWLMGNNLLQTENKEVEEALEEVQKHFFCPCDPYKSDDDNQWCFRRQVACINPWHLCNGRLPWKGRK